MRCLRFFLGTALFMLASSTFAADPVSVRLLPSVDAYCDGQSRMLTTSAVMPGSCIQYRLVVSNTGDVPVVSTRVSAFVPQHTQLHIPLQIVSGRSLVSEARVEAMPSATELGIRLGQMQPGTVTLKYTVRVNH